MDEFYLLKNYALLVRIVTESGVDLVIDCEHEDMHIYNGEQSSDNLLSVQEALSYAEGVRDTQKALGFKPERIGTVDIS